MSQWICQPKVLRPCFSVSFHFELQNLQIELSLQSRAHFVSFIFQEYSLFFCDFDMPRKLCEMQTELSQHSDACFADLLDHKRSETYSFLTCWSATRAFATVWRTFFRPHLPKVRDSSTTFWRSRPATLETWTLQRPRRALDPKTWAQECEITHEITCFRTVDAMKTWCWQRPWSFIHNSEVFELNQPLNRLWIRYLNMPEHLSQWNILSYAWAKNNVSSGVLTNQDGKVSPFMNCHEMKIPIDLWKVPKYSWFGFTAQNRMLNDDQNHSKVNRCSILDLLIRHIKRSGLTCLGSDWQIINWDGSPNQEVGI